MAEKFPEVKASAFVLVDEDGNARGTLSCKDGNAALSLANADGKVGLTAGVAADGVARIMLVGADGSARIGMDLYPAGPSFFVRDADGNVVIGFDFAEASGDAIVFVCDSAKNTRLALRTNVKGPGSSVEVRDAEGNLRIKISADDALPGVSILDHGRAQTIINDDSISLFGLKNSVFINSGNPPDATATTKKGKSSVAAKPATVSEAPQPSSPKRPRKS